MKCSSGRRARSGSNAEWPSASPSVRVENLSKRAAEEPAHVENLVLTGMNCARINCAHDDAEVWTAMINNVRAAARSNRRSCLVLMDLAGPKIRTRHVMTPSDRKTVTAGDRLLLAFAKPAENTEFAFQTSCTMPSVMTQVAAGAVVSIKDGLIQGVIDEVRNDGLVMRIPTPQDRARRCATGRDHSARGRWAEQLRDRRCSGRHAPDRQDVARSVRKASP